MEARERYDRAAPTSLRQSCSHVHPCKGRSNASTTISDAALVKADQAGVPATQAQFSDVPQQCLSEMSRIEHGPFASCVST